MSRYRSVTIVITIVSSAPIVGCVAVTPLLSAGTYASNATPIRPGYLRVSASCSSPSTCEDVLTTHSLHTILALTAACVQRVLPKTNMGVEG